MTKTYMLAILFMLGGVGLLIFQAIDSMMTDKTIEWQHRTLASTFGENTFAWIHDIPVLALHNLAKTVVNAEMYLVLFGTGILLFLVGMILKKV